MVRILSTTQQYERGLDSFNELGPLSLREKISHTLTLPVAEKNPVDNDLQSRGKVLSCDHQGSLICHNKFSGYTYGATYNLWIPGGDPVRDITFTAKCDAFQIMATNWAGSPELYLRDIHGHRLKRLYENERYFLYIAVSKIYFLLAGIGARTVDIVVHTFTKT